MAHPAETKEFVGRLRVVEQVHRHHQIHGFIGLELRDIRAQVPAALRLPPLLLFGKLDHALGDVDPGDLSCARLLEQPRVEAIPARQIQHRPVPHVAQQFEQRVPLHVVAERQPLGRPVLLGNRIVIHHPTLHSRGIHGPGIVTGVPAV